MDLRDGRLPLRLWLVRRTSGAPTAPWHEEDEESVFTLVLRRTADQLARRLQERRSLLLSIDVTTEDVIVEIRRQIAASAIDDPIGAADLSELLLELVRSKENANRPF